MASDTIITITITFHATLARMIISIVILVGAQQSSLAKPSVEIVAFIPMVYNAPVIQISHVGIGTELIAGNFIYGEIMNLSDRPIENAVITATLPVVSGSWPSTTTVVFTFGTRFSVTLPGNSNPFKYGLPVTAQLNSIAGEPLISATAQFGNSSDVQRVNIVQLNIPSNDTHFASALLKNNNSYAVYSVTLSVWTLPQCNGIIEWPITNVLRSGESISKTVPLCPYSGPIQGVIDAVAQGKNAP